MFEDVFEKLTELRLETVAVLASLLILSLLLFILTKKGKIRLGTKVIVYAGFAIALAFVLSTIRIFRMPQGGSVTPASMLPLFIFAFMFGPLPGLTAGALYGFLQLLQDAYVVHWAQLLIDYPLAFASIGLAGFFKKNRILGIIAGSLSRLFFHFLSGFIFFSDYAPQGQDPALYSIIYNGSYMAAEAVITILLAIPILRALGRNRRLL